MSLSRRSPRSIENALEPLSRSWQPESLLADVQRVWPAAVGETIAAQATPVSERGGAVTVACTASVWAQELELMSPAILARLNGELAGGRVVKLRCTTSPQFFS